jgi:hypothetical protein
MSSGLSIADSTDLGVKADFRVFLHRLLAMNAARIDLSGSLRAISIRICHLKIVRGDIFLRKMPLDLKLSVKGRIETAVAPFSSYCAESSHRARSS